MIFNSFKNTLTTVLFFTITSFLVVQTNTEVYLFDIVPTDGGYLLENKKNVSNNNGYDSQPYFYENDQLIYASNRDGQTDIVLYDLKKDRKIFLNHSSNGGEYSPQRIPGSKNISAVRLDNSGLQRFYEYDFDTGKSTELVRNLKVAYPFWFNKRILVSSVIGDQYLDLVISDLYYKTNFTLLKNVGRSLHRIPGTEEVSFISKASDQWKIRALNPNNLRTRDITYTDGNFEDICWLPDGTILQAKKNQIMKFNPKTDTQWSVFFTIDDSHIQNITRITVSPDATKIAIVGEEAARFVVQKQLEAYNKRDIDAFADVFAKDVKVYDYPNKLRYKGNDELKKRYRDYFKKTKDLHCKIIKRIEKGNLVIDEELVTANGVQFSAVAIYEVSDGKIISVTFM